MDDRRRVGGRGQRREQCRSTAGKRRVDGRRRLGSRWEGILASGLLPSPTGPQQKRPAMTRPALPGRDASFISSNKIPLTHTASSLLSSSRPKLSCVVSDSSPSDVLCF